MLNLLLALFVLCFITCNRTPAKTGTELTQEDINAAWVMQDEQSKQAVPQLDLYFSHPVSPADVKNKLKLEIEGKPVAFNVQTLSDNSDITLRLQGIAAQDKDI